MNPPSSGSSGLDFKDSKGLSQYKSQSYEQVPSQPSEPVRSSQPAPQPTATKSAPQQQQQPQPQANPQVPRANEPPYKWVMKYSVLFLDVFFAFLVSSAGALGIGASTSINDSAQVFVGLYLILFSGILLFHECMTICRISRIEGVIKRNVGFLYGPIGKGCYLIL